MLSMSIDESINTGRDLLAFMAKENSTARLQKGLYANNVSIARTLSETKGESWTNFVENKWVEDIIQSLPLYPKNCDSCKTWEKILVDEYMRDGTDNQSVSCKIVHIEALLRIAAQTKCQDKRLEDLDLKIVDIDTLPDEVMTDGTITISRILRPGRGFSVRDPLTFNLLFRQMQRTHPTYPSNKTHIQHGTKGITEMFDNLGLGPHKEAVAHRVYLDKYRGFSSTDPDKIHPDIAYKKIKYPLKIEAHIAAGLLPRPTDGLYYRRYVFDQSRVVKASLRKKVKSVEYKPVVWKPRAAVFDKTKGISKSK
jgi:hypothetical protein